MSTISRSNGLWELKAPGEPHYSTSREGGHLLLHARRDCSRMTDPATMLSWKIVNTLWEKDVAASTTEDENDVQWCENCATARCRAWPA